MCFGGLGQVEVRFGWVSRWRDKPPTNQTRKDHYSVNGLWKAEMSNKLLLELKNTEKKC